MAKLALLITALFIFYAFTAQAENEPQLSSYLVSSANTGSLDAVSRFFPLERRGKDFAAIVPAENSSLLLALAPDAQLLDLDLAASLRARLHSYSSAGHEAAPRYHRFEEIASWMRAHEAAKPELVKVIPYGQTAGGRALEALRLSTGGAKPAVILTAATHGDELITTEVLLGLANEILAGSNGVDRIRRILDKLDLFIIPVVNPDGFVARNRYEGRSDPNRSYPWPGRENATPTPSIGALIRFFSSLPVVGSIDFHAYGELIMYPWAYTRSSVGPEPRARFDALTRHMAESNRYVYGPIAEVIYVAPGSSADFYFWKKGSLSLGIEIGNDKAPPPSEFADSVSSQRESTLRFLEAF